jgi:hypothetical protein
LMATKKRPVSLYLSGPMLRKLDRAAKASGKSRSAIAEELLGSALAEGDVMFSALANDTVRRAFANAMTAPGVAAAMAQAMGHELSDRERQQVLGFFKAAEASR